MNAILPADESAPLRIAVLMASYKDARFLAEQLASIRDQHYPNIELWISRDCDTPEIGRILNDYAPNFNRFTVLRGPCRGGGKWGASANFLSMVFNQSIQADYYAFADQDDIWKPDKLSRAIEILKAIPPCKPALYTGRSELADMNGKPFGMTPAFDRRKPSFQHALVQNLASGHTSVINHAARTLLCEAKIKDIPLFDWWVYLVVSGAEGSVHYDSKPYVLYRIHDKNATSTYTSLLDRYKRLWKHVASGSFKSCRRVNIEALQQSRHVLTPHNRNRLDAFGLVLRSNPFIQLKGLLASGVHRQTYFSTFRLYCLTLISRWLPGA